MPMQASDSVGLGFCLFVCLFLALVWPLTSSFAIRIFKFKMPMIGLNPLLLF